VRRNILRTAEDVHKINIDRDVKEPAINRLFEYARRFWIVNRHWNDLEAGRLKITWDVECWLTCLSFSFNTEHCYGPRLFQQVRDFGEREHRGIEEGHEEQAGRSKRQSQHLDPVENSAHTING